ncbi:hypothetical protein KCP74_21210 [Salmonella enterica subsp. enterica]|nr:hypothetical protein KCP74_21210 [Salmonella enterica subsp. enterica]
MIGFGSACVMGENPISPPDVCRAPMDAEGVKTYFARLYEMVAGATARCRFLRPAPL